jgi:hypothetical protein
MSKSHKFRVGKIKEYLRVDLTPEELQQKGKELAESNSATVALNNDLDRIKADFKAKLSAEESKISLLSGTISSGYEMRDVECKVEFNKPRDGRKTITRLDTNAKVREQDMSAEEMQEVLDFEKAESETASADGKAEADEREAKSGDTTEKGRSKSK